MARYANIETFPEHLEIYDPSSDKRILEAAGDPENPQPIKSFIRSVYIQPPLFTFASLHRLLAITDRELNKCAKLCGAVTVPHQWGIITRYSGQEHLVAEVDYIVGEDMDYLSSPDTPYTIEENLLDGLNTYNSTLRSRRRGHLFEMSRRQFMYGINANQPEETHPSLHLVDIDPIFRVLDTPN